MFDRFKRVAKKAYSVGKPLSAKAINSAMKAAEVGAKANGLGIVAELAPHIPMLKETQTVLDRLEADNEQMKKFIKKEGLWKKFKEFSDGSQTEYNHTEVTPAG